MADLLECLLQIKGLRHSVDRLGALAEVARTGGDGAGAAVSRAAAEMGAAEERWQSVLAGALPGRDWRGRPVAAPHAADAIEAFASARRLTLEVLDCCSAGDLGTLTTAPGIGRVTVADVVAHMLAHDTERLGALKVSLANDRNPPTV